MAEDTQEKDYFVLKVALTAVFFISIALALKLNENEKFSPIKKRVQEELQLMDIRIIKPDYE